MDFLPLLLIVILVVAFDALASVAGADSRTLDDPRPWWPGE